MSNNNHTIKLRVPEPEDIETLVNWENDTSIWHAGITTIPYSRFEVEQFILQNKNDAFQEKQVRFLITLASENTSIGTADLFDINALHRRAGVGIMIVQEHRNKGYAKQALQLIEQYAFQSLWLQQIYANIHAANSISIDLFKAAGFNHNGTKKAWIKTPQRFMDEFFMQKLNPEYHG
ncbi:MAG: GNAT family N-acetyltransferase [Bacteroidales bacterium]